MSCVDFLFSVALAEFAKEITTVGHFITAKWLVRDVLKSNTQLRHWTGKLTMKPTLSLLHPSVAKAALATVVTMSNAAYWFKLPLQRCIICL